jgi:signal transduction histidine kinase
VLTAISGSLDASAALRTLAHLAVPALADWCLVEMVEREREVRVLEIVASDPRKQPLLRAMLSSYPHTTNVGRHPVGHVLRTGEAQLIPRLGDEDLQRIAYDAMHLRLLRELGARSMMIVPLVAERRVLGALTFAAAESGREYVASDLHLVEEVAQRAAAVVESARRFERAEQEKQSAEMAADRARRLERVMSALPLWSRLTAEDASPIAEVLRSSRDVPEAEAALLHDSAGKCAHALERALLYEREQRALAEARHAVRSRDEVLGIVAHDHRNPVSAIATYASLLEDTGAPAGKRRAWARAVHDLTGQMQKLIQDLLDVSKIESGTLTLDPRPVSAASLVQDAVTLMQPVATAAGVHIRHKAAASLPKVIADADRLRQVFSNLLGNAIRHSPAGGEVNVRAESLGDEVLYLVTDTGPGIALEDRPHLFNRFWQARRGRHGGAGLGLAISKGIVERHGGRIGVESRLGAGSTFFFTLPCPAPDPTGGDV